VDDRSGHTLALVTRPTPEEVLPKPRALQLVNVMRGVIDEGTGSAIRTRWGIQADVAGKTGTTQDDTDGWFILMHPQLVAGAWVGFDDNRVTMRSSYWGQGAHNALFIVGDLMQQAEKAGVIDAKATFSAPHTRDEEKPLVDRMGDWWNSVFNAAPADPTVATMPPATAPVVTIEGPQLQPPPPALPASPLATGQPSSPPVSADAPVIVSEPQRVPSFPRPLESARAVDTVPGTQVYRSPDAPAVRPPDASTAAEGVRGPAQPRVAGSMQGAPGATGAMGAAPGGSGSSRETATAATARDGYGTSAPRASTTITVPRDGSTVTQRDAAASGSTHDGASGTSRRSGDSYDAIPSSRRDSAGGASYGNASGAPGGGSSWSSGSASASSSDSSVGTATGSPSAAE
jgi:penicillin-binding protein 1A